jgi:hypothetical protein
MSIETSWHQFSEARMAAYVSARAYDTEREAAEDAETRARRRKLQAEVAAFTPAADLSMDMLKAAAPRLVEQMLRTGLAKVSPPNGQTYLRMMDSARHRRSYHKLKARPKS